MSILVTRISSSRRRLAPAAAVALGVLTLGLGLAHAPLDLLTHQLAGDRQLVADWLTSAGFSGPAAVVGTLLAARRPGNPIGWILLGIFLVGGSPSGDYAVLDYRMHHGTLPFGQVAVVLVGGWPIWLVLIAIFLWLFPDGRPGAGAECHWSCSPAGRFSGWRPRRLALRPWLIMMSTSTPAAA